MSNDSTTTVEVSRKAMAEIVRLNREARHAIEPAGGNSVQEGYRNACISKLDDQYRMVEIFGD